MNFSHPRNRTDETIDDDYSPVVVFGIETSSAPNPSGSELRPEVLYGVCKGRPGFATLQTAQSCSKDGATRSAWDTHITVAREFALGLESKLDEHCRTTSTPLTAANLLFVGRQALQSAANDLKSRVTLISLDSGEPPQMASYVTQAMAGGAQRLREPSVSFQEQGASLLSPTDNIPQRSDSRVSDMSSYMPRDPARHSLVSDKSDRSSVLISPILGETSGLGGAYLGSGQGSLPSGLPGGEPVVQVSSDEFDYWERRMRASRGEPSSSTR